MNKPLSVLSIVLNTAGDQVLLVHRRDVNIWALPGGGVDAGEDPEKAAAREVKEETGLIVKPVRQAAVFTPINKLTTETHLFVCEVAGGELTHSNETRAAAFFPLNRLPSPHFYIHREWIELALDNPGRVVRRPLNEVTYWKLFLYFVSHPIRVLRTLLSRLGLPYNTYCAPDKDEV